MNIQEEIRSLSRISENFRKSKKPKSKWPVEFQLRVLKLIEMGLSPQVLSKKLNIPVQTYYHWRRLWKNSPKKNLNFLEIPISDNLKGQPSLQKEGPQGPPLSSVIVLPSGARIENVSADVVVRILKCYSIAKV